MHNREELIEQIAETLSDTSDMDVSWRQYATAIVDRLIKIGTIVPCRSYVALYDIASERERHLNVEGWTAEHDDQHAGGEMAAAAACYATGDRHETTGYRAPSFRTGTGYTTVGRSSGLWPWSREWWKPTDKRRNLIKAGALIVAEIDRLDRIAEDQRTVV